MYLLVELLLFILKLSGIASQWKYFPISLSVIPTRQNYQPVQLEWICCHALSTWNILWWRCLKTWCYLRI